MVKTYCVQTYECQKLEKKITFIVFKAAKISKQGFVPKFRKPNTFVFVRSGEKYH